MDNTKTAEEIAIATLTGASKDFDLTKIDDYDRKAISIMVRMMEEYASPLKKRIEELEAGLKVIDYKIDNVTYYTDTDIKHDINEVLHPSTNGKQD